MYGQWRVCKCLCWFAWEICLPIHILISFPSWKCVRITRIPCLSRDQGTFFSYYWKLHCFAKYWSAFEYLTDILFSIMLPENGSFIQFSHIALHPMSLLYIWLYDSLFGLWSSVYVHILLIYYEIYDLLFCSCCETLLMVQIWVWLWWWIWSWNDGKARLPWRKASWPVLWSLFRWLSRWSFLETA